MMDDEDEDPKYGKKGRVTTRSIVVVLIMFLVMGMFMYQVVSIGLESLEDNLRGEFNAVVGKSAQDFNGERKKSQGGLGEEEEEEEDNMEKLNLDPKLVTYMEDGSPIGYIRVPKIPKKRPGDDPKLYGDDRKLHIIFSSGCNYFQHWQSEFLLATAHLVGQRGRITRLVSGCHDKRAEKRKHKDQTFPEGKNDLLVPLELLNRSVNPNFGLFVTPSFEGALDFPWINKPSSINYFMEHARPELDRLGETVVVILDPDFLFLRPLTQTGEGIENIIVSKEHLTDPNRNYPIDVVKKGRPVAQRYGLGGGWTKYDIDFVTGDPSSPAKKWSYDQAAHSTSVGPPLMLHVDDLTTLSKYWRKYMAPVLKLERDILADMWAYSIASAHLGLHHTTLDNYMISVWGDDGQAFKWVNEWDRMSCLAPKAPPGKKFPVFIHLASNFKAFYPDESGKLVEWMFHKGHVPASILECDSPLIIEAPDELFNYQVKHKSVHDQQRAWILCHTIARLNHVALLYKKKFCPKGFEQRKLIHLIQRKTGPDRHCDDVKQKWCYPLAQIEGLPSDWRDWV